MLCHEKITLKYNYITDPGASRMLDFGAKGSRFKSRPGGPASMFAKVTFLTRY